MAESKPPDDTATDLHETSLQGMLHSASVCADDYLLGLLIRLAKIHCQAYFSSKLLQMNHRHMSWMMLLLKN